MRLLAPALVVVVLLTVGAIAFRPRTPLAADATQTSAGNTSTQAVPVANTPPPRPTPRLASYRGLVLHMPVPKRSVTCVAFHQASYPNAQHMAPAYKGKVNKLWRSGRVGPPDTAVDVGGAPGSKVVSPVSGTVVEVREYNLYNKYPDYQIHIVPDGWANLEVVLIHITDVIVKPGDVVVAGVTPMARIRRLSDRFRPQLAEVSRDDGDHVHMQLNAEPDTATPTPVGR